MENDGVPEAPPAGRPGSGLAGLRERLAELGGTLRAGPAGTGRFRLTARVPLPPGEQGEQDERDPLGAAVRDPRRRARRASGDRHPTTGDGRHAPDDGHHRPEDDPASSRTIPVSEVTP
ncbi:hypothetical protein ACFQ1B_17770 [Streptomyces mexicanus]